jgi:hypothetical protein
VLGSPAKTNLFLRITRKREDGFHELASVFQVPPPERIFSCYETFSSGCVFLPVRVSVGAAALAAPATEGVAP